MECVGTLAIGANRLVLALSVSSVPRALAQMPLLATYEDSPKSDFPEWWYPKNFFQARKLLVERPNIMKHKTPMSPKALTKEKSAASDTSFENMISVRKYAGYDLEWTRNSKQTHGI